LESVAKIRYANPTFLRLLAQYTREAFARIPSIAGIIIAAITITTTTASNSRSVNAFIDRRTL
jgi:hypothetical protein